MASDERLQLPDEAAVLTGAEVRLETVLESDEPQLLESRDLALGERLVGEIDEGGPAPKRQRLGQPRRGVRELARVQKLPPLPRQQLEPVGVELAGSHEDGVPAGT